MGHSSLALNIRLRSDDGYIVAEINHRNRNKEIHV
jgi:hypothetical protein